MTLCLAAGNSDCTVVVADRRLTSTQGIEDDEFAKALVFTSPTARVGVTFSGLAKAPGFLMLFALPDLLGQAAKEGPDLERVVEAFAVGLEARFRSLPSSVPDAARRTVVMFAGYRYDAEGSAEIFHRSVANYRRGLATTHPFQVDREDESERFNYIAAIGDWAALPESARAELGALVDGRKPAAAIVGKAVEVMRAAAARSPGQLVGGQILSLVVPADRSVPSTGEYHTETPSDTYFMPGSVTVDAAGGAFSVIDSSVTSGVLTAEEIREHYERGRRGAPHDTTQRFEPIAIPKVGRNRPCPCGSGEKYKRCHGR